MSRNFVLILLALVVQVVCLHAQPVPPAVTPPGQAQTQPLPAQNQQPKDLPPDSIRPNYVLGPNDQILIRAPEADEINEKPFRIHTAGMTLQELEADLVKRLAEFIRTPQVIVTVVQFHSEPVFLVGAFKNPG